MYSPGPMKPLILFASVGFAAGLFAFSCGTAAPLACSPSNCDGCCDSADTCKTGLLQASCGKGGSACNTCVAGQLCAAAVCVFAPVDGGTDAGPADAGPADAGQADAGTADAGLDAGTDAGAPCAPRPITCSDQAIQSLDLKNTVNLAAITNTSEDAGFRITVDATAGGFAPTMSFVYGKFTPTGLQKVSLSDEAALVSVDWDIAFRRFVIRLNGGSSGPSCVSALATAVGTSYDTATSAPSKPTVVDDFQGPPPGCTFKDDNSGLNTSPSTALGNAAASFYAYNNCVGMTGRVFVIRTREGRNVKLVVTNYYPSDAAQMTCNSGTSPGVAGGTIKARWSFLD